MEFWKVNIIIGFLFLLECVLLISSGSLKTYIPFFASTGIIFLIYAGWDYKVNKHKNLD